MVALALLATAPLQLLVTLLVYEALGEHHLHAYSSPLWLPAATAAGGAALIGWMVCRRAEPRVRHCAGLLGLLAFLIALSAGIWKLVGHVV
jgi:hypothetical protein